jgi:hypothetical protein
MKVDSGLASVFRSEVIGDGPFRASVSERVILYPVLSPALPRDLVEALVRSVDPRCWLCFVGVVPRERRGELASRAIDLRDVDGYLEATRHPYPHALAATDSSWGAITSEEPFALLGARVDVMRQLKSENPFLDFDRQRLGFEMEFADDGEWPRRIVEYISTH